MNSRLILRMIAPTVGVALILLLLGAFAAWYVHSLEQENVITQQDNVKKVTAAEELVVISHDLRHALSGYATREDDGPLGDIRSLPKQARKKIAECEDLADSDAERSRIEEIERRYTAFEDSIRRITQDESSAASRSAAMRSLSNDVNQQILEPVIGYRKFIGARMKLASDHDQLLADRLGLGLLVVGVCGAVAGLVAGFGFARSVHRSFVQVSVPVHDAAGKLSEAIGPIHVAADTLGDLESTMQTVAERVGAVVEQLQESQAVARRSEQLASLGQLAAGIAHELRNPLTSMKIIVQTAAEQSDAATLDARDLAVLTEEITRLESRIQAFLDFARPPKPVKRPCVVRESLLRTIDFVSYRARQMGIKIECEYPDEIFEIQADSGQLREVLLNLLLNAIDASPEDTTIRVRLRHLTGPASRPGQAAPSDGIQIDVQDEGSGLPEDFGETIFEPFVSTKDSGTGLGLSICKRIVEDHGGRITAANAPDGGAIFSVQLPAGQQEVQTCPDS